MTVVVAAVHVQGVLGQGPRHHLDHHRRGLAGGVVVLLDAVHDALTRGEVADPAPAHRVGDGPALGRVLALGLDGQGVAPEHVQPALGERLLVQLAALGRRRDRVEDARVGDPRLGVVRHELVAVGGDPDARIRGLLPVGVLVSHDPQAPKLCECGDDSPLPTRGRTRPRRLHITPVGADRGTISGAGRAAPHRPPEARGSPPWRGARPASPARPPGARGAAVASLISAFPLPPAARGVAAESREVRIVAQSPVGRTWGRLARAGRLNRPAGSDRAPRIGGSPGRTSRDGSGRRARTRRGRRRSRSPPRNARSGRRRRGPRRCPGARAES